MKSRRAFFFGLLCAVTMLLVAGIADRANAQLKAAGGDKIAGNKKAGQGPKGGSAILGGASSFAVPLKKGEDPTDRLKVDQIMWSGATPDLAKLKGKSVVVFFYATWCPKCNEWSGEFFRQMLIGIAKQPVVVLAVNADPKDPTLKYVKERGFDAPNIYHGYDPNLPMRLGYKSNLFNYVLIGPDGLVKEEGYLGTSKFVDPNNRKGPKIYVLAKKLHDAKDLGKFDMIQPEFPPAVVALLWPLELGQSVDGSMLMKASRMFKGEKKEEFEQAINSFLDAQLEKMKTLSDGEIADKLEAYAKAEPFAKQFRAFPQAKEVREILDKFKKDRDFKKEVTAKRLYDKATAKGVSEKRRQGMLRGLVKRFEGTYYATKAAGELQ